MKRNILIKNMVASLIVFGFSACCLATPWLEDTPGFFSDDERFTTTVEFADIDGNDYPDLVVGNYKYPYQFDVANPEIDILQGEFIGGGVFAYRNYDGVIDPAPVEFESLQNMCVECIALGDYNGGGPDLAVGLLVGYGKDGGVRVYDNRGAAGTRLGFL